MKRIPLLIFLAFPLAAFAPLKHYYGERMDVIELAAVIEAEAGGETFTGKYLVGSVAVNRMRDSLWSDDLTDVLTQESQFARAKEPSSESLAAAERALYFPFPGIKYFVNPKIATNKEFISRLEVCFDLGNHRFCEFYNWQK
ncbi:MAG: cell wall hydrolase [Chitinophagales bacterium]|nr:cell wall hydrolase [Chitinophagales bacterium]